MNVIYKYELKPVRGTAEIEVMMPFGAAVLQAGVQGEDIFIWAQIDDTEKTNENRLFEVYGTGHEMLADYVERRTFVNTVFLGPLVFHVFQIGETGT